MVFNHNQGKDIRDGRVWGERANLPSLVISSEIHWQRSLFPYFCAKFRIYDNMSLFNYVLSSFWDYRGIFLYWVYVMRLYGGKGQIVPRS